MRPRRVTTRPFPLRRLLVVHALRVGKRQAPVHGLLSLDVTEPRRRLKDADPPLSFTAFVVACVARAAAAHPEVHAYRDWRGRLVTHEYVDVATLFEVDTPDGVFPMAHLVRDADIRSIAEISSEIRSVKSDPTRSRSGKLLRRMAPIGARVPGLFTLLYRAARRSVRMRGTTGTVAVTSVGMFGGGGGFGISFPTILTLTVLVGGMSEQPRVVDGQIVVREVLDLTITIDHEVVDGAPAARFGAELRTMIEAGEGL